MRRTRGSFYSLAGLPRIQSGASAFFIIDGAIKLRIDGMQGIKGLNPVAGYHMQRWLILVFSFFLQRGVDHGVEYGFRPIAP